MDTRTVKAKAAFYNMRPVLLNKNIHSKLRASLYTALVANNTLWGCESWAMTKKHYEALDTLQNYCVRRMSGMTLYHCQLCRRSMEEMHEMLHLPKHSTTARIDKSDTMSRSLINVHPDIRQIIGYRQVSSSLPVVITQPPNLPTAIAGLCGKGGGEIRERILILAGVDASQIIEENLGGSAGTFALGC
jgi:hypothetical protein